MAMIAVSILSFLFIFGIVTHASSDPDKSMNTGANRITTLKMDENKGLVQKKKKPAQNPVRSIKKGSSKSQSAFGRRDDGIAIVSTRRDVDFLKAVEEKKKARWIGLDQILYSPELLPSTCNNDSFSSREVPATKSSNTDFSQSTSKTFPAGSKYFEGGTKSETLRHLESKKEEILGEIFMGFHFSFTPTTRHVVLKVNGSSSGERGPGLVIPF